MHRSGHIYTLKTEFLPVEELPEGPAWVVEMLRDSEQASTKSGDLDLALVEKRRGNIDVILARVLPTLPELARAALNHPDSCPSYSEARYRVIGGLMHLPNDEIAALIHYWADTDKLPWGHLDGKSLRQKNGDVLRCIDKHEARMAKKGKPRMIVPTRSAGLLPAQPLTKPKARSDRPQHLTTAQLLAWYEQEANSGVILMKVDEVAAARQVSERTIQRIERRLEADGLIARESKRHTSWVRLLKHRGDNIAAVSPLPNALATLPDQENVDRSALYIHTFLSDQDREEKALALGGDLSPLADEHLPAITGSRLDTPPTLPDIVVEYLDHYTQPPREVLDRKTGEIRIVPYTHTVKRFTALLDETMPGQWPKHQIRSVYHGIVKRARLTTGVRNERSCG